MVTCTPIGRNAVVLNHPRMSDPSPVQMSTIDWRGLMVWRTPSSHESCMISLLMVSLPMMLPVMFPTVLPVMLLVMTVIVIVVSVLKLGMCVMSLRRLGPKESWQRQDQEQH